MRCLTVCQPHAHLIVHGPKCVENRRWPTSYRGPILIHAGKSHDWLELDDHGQRDLCYDIPLYDMAFGAIVGAAVLLDCLPLELIASRANAGLKHPSGISYEELFRHEHTNGPVCWILDNVVRFLEPIPYRGSLGLPNIPDEIAAEQLAKAIPVVSAFSVQHSAFAGGVQ